MTDGAERACRPVVVRLAAVVALVVVGIVGTPALGSRAAAGQRNGLTARSGATTASTPITPPTAGTAPTADMISQSAADPVRVLVDRIDPRIATPNTPIRVFGRLVAVGSQPVTDLVVRLHLGSRITSRGQLHQIRDAPTALGPIVARVPLSGPLAPGGSLPFSLTRPLAGLGLAPQLAVYPLQVTVTGTVGGQSRLIARADTFVTYAPERVGAPTPVTWVVPLTDRPRLGPAGQFLDDELAAEVAPPGRLARILAAALESAGRPAQPITLAVDPALVEEVQVMATGPYRVAAGSGSIVRPRSADAANFLDKLRTFARSGGSLAALPYGDVDVAALTHAGLAADLARARQRGDQVLRDVLGTRPAADTRVAYPPSGVTDTEMLEQLAALGATTVVLDAAVLPSGTGLPYTPTAVMRLTSQPGPQRALVVDSELSRLAGDTRGASDAPQLAQQSLDAELAMVTAELPGVARPVVVTVPRDWDPPAAWAQFSLDALQATPWARPVSLADLARTPARGHVELAYPAAARAAELPATHLIALDALRNEIGVFRSILPPVRASTPGSPTAPAPGTSSGLSAAPSSSVLSSAGPCGGTAALEPPVANAPPVAAPATGQDPGGLSTDALTAPLDAALLRAESADFQSDPAAADALRSSVAGRLEQLRGCVRVAASRVVTLTSRSGKVPITLENDLPERVTVQLVVSAFDKARSGPGTIVPRTVNPRQKVRVEIQVRAESAGTFPVQLSLLTPDGRPLSTPPPLRMLVRSTVYGIVAVAVTGSALGVLALAVLVRLVRRLRALRHPAAA